MVQQITITGGLAQIIETRILKQVPLDDLLPKLATPLNINMLGLPHGARFLNAVPGQPGMPHLVHVVIEQPPSTRTIRNEGTRTQHTLRMPWVYFFIDFNLTPDQRMQNLNDWRVYVAKERVTKLEDKLWRAPIHNVYNDGRICFGTAGIPVNNNWGDWCDQAVTNFWNSGFNYAEMLQHPWDPANQQYDKWQEDGEDDPVPWMKWNWDPAHASTLAERLAYNNDRAAPVVALNGIPDLAFGATFGRVAEWVNDLEPQQRDMLRTALGA